MFSKILAVLVVLAFANKPTLATVTATTSLAPLNKIGTADESSPIPRFANFSTPLNAYSILACPAQP